MHHCRAEGLRNYFSEFGKVEDCTILRDQDGRSRGFAFLTFEDPNSVNAVMVREHILDGKAVRFICSPHPVYAHIHVVCPSALDRSKACDTSGRTSS